MNIPNTKTIAKIDSKVVNIKTHGQEIIHITVILWIVADGSIILCNIENIESKYKSEVKSKFKQL